MTVSTDLIADCVVPSPSEPPVGSGAACPERLSVGDSRVSFWAVQSKQTVSQSVCVLALRRSSLREVCFTWDRCIKYPKLASSRSETETMRCSFIPATIFFSVSRILTQKKSQFKCLQAFMSLLPVRTGFFKKYERTSETRGMVLMGILLTEFLWW